MQLDMIRATFLAIIAVLVVVMLAPAASAQTAASAPDTIYVVTDQPSPCRKHLRKGFFVGFNVGSGGSGIGFTRGDEFVSERPAGGPFGGLRLGIAVSNSIAFAIEAYGLGVCENDHAGADSDDEQGLGAAFVTVTWWPGGEGFFMRLGFGAGGGNVMHRATGKKIHFEDRDAALFGLGYEWRLSKHFALGAAVDAIGFELDDLDGDGPKEDFWAGFGGASIQLNWYL